MAVGLQGENVVGAEGARGDRESGLKERIVGAQQVPRILVKGIDGRGNVKKNVLVLFGYEECEFVVPEADPTRPFDVRPLLPSEPFFHSQITVGSCLFRFSSAATCCTQRRTCSHRARGLHTYF